MQLGQSLPLQLKATRRSKRHCGQRTRASGYSSNEFLTRVNLMGVFDFPANDTP